VAIGPPWKKTVKGVSMMLSRMSALALAALLARSTFASPLPTPTPTPTPHDGPVLDVTFSGVVLFLKTTPGYRVIVPARQAQKHLPYMMFPRDGATASNWDTGEFECDNAWHKWVSLTAGTLSIEPESSIAPESFNAAAIEGWLPHLRDLTGNNPVIDEDYNQATPVIGKVAAQIDITRGTLRPLILDKPYEPVQWEFRSKDGSRKSNARNICGTAGIRWLLPIRKNIRSISIVSSLMNHPKVTVPLVNGQTTVVVIGNSMADDIECPKREPQDSDPDFELHYKMLKAAPATAWIPYRVTPKATCAPPPETKGNKSKRGTDCLPAQSP
jgi:hypothetical protein